MPFGTLFYHTDGRGEFNKFYNFTQEFRITEAIVAFSTHNFPNILINISNPPLTPYLIQAFIM
jgi:hypothetical protein